MLIKTIRSLIMRKIKKKNALFQIKSVYILFKFMKKMMLPSCSLILFPKFGVFFLFLMGGCQNIV